MDKQDQIITPLTMENWESFMKDERLLGKFLGAQIFCNAIFW